jgi:hypothetical protein
MLGIEAVKITAKNIEMFLQFLECNVITATAIKVIVQNVAQESKN